MAHFWKRLWIVSLPMQRLRLRAWKMLEHPMTRLAQRLPAAQPHSSLSQNTSSIWILPSASHTDSVLVVVVVVAVTASEEEDESVVQFRTV
jgi:hypothetical protein